MIEAGYQGCGCKARQFLRKTKLLRMTGGEEAGYNGRWLLSTLVDKGTGCFGGWLLRLIAKDVEAVNCEAGC